MSAIASHVPDPRPALAGEAALAPMCAVLIWTGNTIVTKTAATAIEPAAITFYRWVLAFLVLTPFLGPAVWRQRQIVWAHAPKLATLGLLGMATYQGLAYEAARTTSAVNMGVMLALGPLTTALLASALAAEPLTWRRIIGALVSLAGLIELTTRGDPLALLRADVHAGDGLMLIAVTANSLYGVLLRRWTMALSTWPQIYAQIGFAILIVTPFWLASSPSPITAGNAPLIVYAGIFASIGAPYFWITGVKRLGAAPASLFLNLLPLFIAAAAWVFLGERLHVYHAIGGAVALAGVALGLSKGRRSTG
jgi:drug/metabolite transporter (DMT)-like permease